MSYSDNPFIPQMLSPAAYEIGRYGRTPASHFYGLPNISIPLTEVRAKGYSLPVSLSYHAGGNKPEQHPGWVGLGWSLNAGGSIVRIVNGKKDEMSVSEHAALTGRYLNADPGYLHHIDDVQTSINWNDAQTFWNKTFFDDMEYAPDEYIINAPGIHASFFITGSNTNGSYKIAIVSRDESSFELESFEIGNDSSSPQLDIYPGKCTRPIKACRYKYLRKFIIRDKSGNRYIFGGDDSAIEYSIVQKADLIRTSTGVTNSNVWKAFATANAWMLTKIERADGEVITFEYERNGVPIVLRDIHHGEAFASTDAPEMSGQVDTYQDMVTGYKRNLNFHFLLPTYLKSIKCMQSGDELLFTTENTQELPFDINEADFKTYVVDLGSVDSTVGPFTYAEFQAENRYRKLTAINGNSRDIRLAYIENVSTRLKLDKIEFYNGNQKDRAYALTYNSTSLPAYNSRQTDIWGYYNGISYSDLLGSFGSGMTARRIAVKAKAEAEILTSIVYPTGGRTEFTYELHKYSKKAVPFSFTPETCASEGEAGGLRIKTITDYSDSGISQTRTFEYSENGISSGILCADGECKVEGQQSFINGIYNFTGAYALYSEIPLLPLSDTDGRHVTYSFVRERFPDGSYVDYRFSNFDTSGCQDYAPAEEIGRVSGCPLYPEFTSRALFRGLLNERFTRRPDGTPVLREEFTYGDIGNPNRFKSVSRYSYFGERIVFAAYVSEHCGYPGMLTKKETRYLDDGTQIADSFQYSYNPISRVPVSSRHYRGSDSSEKRFFYPDDRTGAFYTEMQNAGMRGVPIGEAVLRNNGVIQGKELSFIDLDINSDEGTRKILVPHKVFSARFSAPESLSSYVASPSAYMNPAPDIYAKSWDERGNVKFIGLRDGSALEHHWTQRTGRPGMRLKTADAPASSHTNRTANVRLKFGSSEHLTASFKTTEQTYLSVTLVADYNYAWHICVLLDGTYHYLANWAIVETPDANWANILSLYGNTLNISVPAGNHSLSIYHVNWKGPGGSAEASGGSILCTYAESAPFNDISSFVDLDVDTESGEGFHCAKGHTGSLTVNHPVTAGKTYVLDYMLKNGGTWQYFKTSYTGGAKTIGASGQTISNVRIYPTDSLPESFSWRKFSGMSAVIDSHGVSQSYTYDGAGRLAEVRDNGGSRIKAHSYMFGDGADVRTDIFTVVGGGTKRTMIDHYDGLGRIAQNIIFDGSPSGKDIVTLHEYDNMDREVKTWLPVPIQQTEGTVASNDDIVDAAGGIYENSEAGTLAHSLSVYEPSPQNRLLRKYGPGKSWRDADKSVMMSLMSNGTSASQPTYYRGFSISWSGTALSLVRNSAATVVGTFLIEKTVDEDGRTRYEFKNMHGETVLSREIVDGGSWNDTHFIYDAFGRLAAVLPPKLTVELESASKTSWTESEISQHAYLYRYDSRGNCIAKLLPGGGWTYYVYDQGDRLILSQDVMQRSNGRWTFSLVDLFGRECVTGTVAMTKDVFADPLGSSNVYVTMPSSPSYTGILKGYEINGLSLGSNVEILNVNYYDGYGFLGSGPFPAATNANVAYDASAGSEYGARYALSERGLQTGGLVKVLDSSGGEAYLWSVAYYDDRGRPVQTRELMHIGGVRKEYYGYDFTGNITKRKTIQTPTVGGSATVVQTFTYDAMGRPLKTTHQVGTGAQAVVSDKTYDEVGRLTSDLRTGLFQLKEERTYNLRSWLTGISGAMFNEELSYENSSAPQWGGNISSVEWNSGSVQKRYQLGYDSLSRLVSASFYSDDSYTPAHSETYAYDQNGNMSSHARAGQAQSLNYTGNRLVNVGSAGFSYDAKGRQTSAGYGTAVTTEYNLLDLPQKHTVGGGTTVVEYKYAADGRKLQENVTSGSLLSRRDYVGDIIYENGVLKRIMFEGGYVYMNGSSRTYMFFLRDHLGSVRAVVSQMGAVQQTNEYYPFGDLFPTSGTDNSGNRFRFTGKELGAEAGLYDFSARFLHPRFGRFTTLDPLAEKYPNISPYAYCNGNPVNFVDPDGMDWYAYYLGRQDSYENMLPYMSYAWTEAKSQEELDALGIQGIYMGEAVVVFDGYYDEKLGKDGTLTGEGAKPADVTVYGPRGADDIESYIGYTMSSDPSLFGVIANGQYEVHRHYPGPYGSEWAINKRGKVPALNGFNPAYPDRSPGYLDNTLIHRNDLGGFTWRRYSYKEKRMVNISEGCLIINYDKWDRFNATFENLSKFLLVLNRK